MRTWQPGQRLGTALVLAARAGRGGMGEVWRAHDEVLGRDVAVKLLHATDTTTFDGVADDSAAQALQTLMEARAAARVVHPHVVAVYALGTAHGLPYIEMEWLDGRSLRERLRRAAVDGMPHPRDVAVWLVQVAAALDCAHRQGVVHCDVKPENVMLQGDGQGGWIAKLADFGLARNRADGTADAPLQFGTPAYLAPELHRTAPTPASDVYALAATACELLTGRPPQRARDSGEAIVQGSETALPSAARDVLLQALAVEPQRRPQSAGSWADALLRALGQGDKRLATRSWAAEAPLATSHEVAIPLVALGIDVPHLLAALQTLLPPWPGVIEVALGGAISGAALETARTTSASLTPWQGMPTRLQRAVLARAAWALEQCGPLQPATREEATRLYIAAHRLPDAVRLALQSAAATPHAPSRRQHLARAAGLAVQPARPRGWLEALLLVVEWDVTCGRLDLVRAPLAEAQGLLADLRLGLDDPLRQRAELAIAWTDIADGRAAAALQRLARWSAWSDDGTVAALALRAAALGALGRCAEAMAVAAPAAAPAFSLAAADLALAQAEAARGDAQFTWRAEPLAWTAHALAATAGDPLRTARAHLALGHLALARGRVETAARHAADARTLLAPIGLVATAADVEHLMAEVAWRQGDTRQALRACLRAEAWAEELQGAAALPRIRATLERIYTAN